MSIFDIFKREYPRTTPKPTFVVGLSIPCPKDGKCPNCGSQSFYEGPSAGLCTNVECCQCHYLWNANSMGFDWQFLGIKE